MDVTQWHLLELIAVLGTPIILFPIIAIAFAWRSISHRALFAVFAFLSLTGLHQVVYTIIDHLIDPPLLGPSTYPSPKFTVLLITATLVGMLGLPVLWRLRNLLRNT